jgi:RimJ/RimL family protein N-acetyltransferase
MNQNFWRGEKIILRGVEEKDLDDALNRQEEMDTEWERFISEIPFPSSPQQDREEMAQLMKRAPGDDNFFWIITDLEGKNIGFIHTWECQPRMGTFRYALGIRREYRGRGYAQEAVRIVMRYYFHEKRYQKVTVNVYAFNEPSLRFHRKFGFVEEGRLRRMVFTHGEYFDEFHFGMTREEFDLIDPPKTPGE